MGTTLLLKVRQEGPGRRDRRESALLGTSARREENTSGKLTMRGRSASTPTSALIARLRDNPVNHQKLFCKRAEDERV